MLLASSVNSEQCTQLLLTLSSMLSSFLALFISVELNFVSQHRRTLHYYLLKTEKQYYNNLMG